MRLSLCVKSICDLMAGTTATTFCPRSPSCGVCRTQCRCWVWLKCISLWYLPTYYFVPEILIMWGVSEAVLGVIFLVTSASVLYSTPQPQLRSRIKNTIFYTRYFHNAWFSLPLSNLTISKSRVRQILKPDWSIHNNNLILIGQSLNNRSLLRFSKQRSRTKLSSLIFHNTLTHKTVSTITSFYCLHSTLNHPIVSTSGWHRSNVRSSYCLHFRLAPFHLASFHLASFHLALFQLPISQMISK